GSAVGKESFGKIVEGFVHIGTNLEKAQVVRADHARFHQIFEVEHLAPEFLSEKHHHHLLGDALGLHQGEHLHHFVQGAETAGKHDDGLGRVHEPEFAHEEIMELEVQVGGNVGIGVLFEGQVDVQSD